MVTIILFFAEMEHTAIVRQNLSPTKRQPVGLRRVTGSKLLEELRDKYQVTRDETARSK